MKVSPQRVFVLAGLIASLMLTACTSEPVKSTQEAKPTEPAETVEGDGTTESGWDGINGTWCRVDAPYCFTFDLPTMTGSADDATSTVAFREMHSDCFDGTAVQDGDGRGLTVLFCPAGAKSPDYMSASNDDIAVDRLALISSSPDGMPWMLRQDTSSPVVVWEDVNGRFCDEGDDCITVDLPNITFLGSLTWALSYNEMDGECFSGHAENPSGQAGSARFKYCPAGAISPDSVDAPNEDFSRDRLMLIQMAGTTWKFRQ